MADAHRDRAANEYWGRDGLGPAILDALVASGKDLDALTVDDMAPLDQFHGGGKTATERLARLADFPPGTHVLDVGGGVGGPARTLVAQFGCRVTLVDPTESYVAAGALITQWMAVRRYHGGCASKNAAALRFARRRFSCAGVSFAAAFRSNEYTPVRSGVRSAKARRPASVIFPLFSSSSTRFTLIALQRLFGRRGVKRIVYASSPRLRRTPSIQPKHSASSTDCGHVRLGLPVCVL